MWSSEINCHSCNFFDRSTIIEKDGKAMCVCINKSVYKQFNDTCKDKKENESVSYQVIKCPDNFMEKYEIDQLKYKINLLDQECNNWMETAKQNLKNTEYYKNIVVSIGELFENSFICDDGAISNDVLCGKVYEVVKEYVDEMNQYINTIRE